ncbi:MAG: hypothetical protein IKL84_00810 [Clostridia bacterium]|nr:hypothetical protein [Clostridia bacterium]
MFGKRRRKPLQLFDVEEIHLPQRPETRRIYVVQQGTIYVNVNAGRAANIDRKFETAQQFVEFIGGIWME